MKIITLTTKLSNFEKETQINYDNIEKTWVMDSTVSTHYNKSLKQGWTPLVQYVYEDGTIAGMILKAPAHAITIRSAEKRIMSEEQKKNLKKINKM